MKKKLVRQLFCMSVAAAMVMHAPAAAMAEAAVEETVEAEAEETVEEAAEAAEEPVEEEEVVIEDVVITVADGEVTVVNTTDKNYTAEYKEIEKEPAEGEEKPAEPEMIWVLTLTDDEEQTYVFEDVKPEEWNEASLVNELGVLYIFYKDAAGADQEAAEKCEEKVLEEKVSVFAMTNVNVREGADTSAQVLKVAALGEEYIAVAALTGWIKVEMADGKEGYISHKYVTTDTELIAQLKKAAEEAAAKAKAEAEAAAQAEAEWQAQQQAQQQSKPQQEQPKPQDPAPEAPAPEALAPQPEEQPVYEVSREKYDDCDGSGHGYWEITYSDGSVAYEEY